MSEKENLLDLINAIYRWRKPIIISCILAALLSAGISLLMPNYYKAKTVFYAGSPDLAKPSPVGESDTDIDIYGTDTDLDRLFSIANSEKIASYLISEFDLFTRYEIDPNDEKAQYKVRLKLADQYNAQKNKFDALELTVEDKDPEVAKNMANGARNKLNEISQAIIKESQSKLVENYKQNIASKEKTKNQLSDSLTQLKSKYKIFSADGQGESLATELSKTNAKLAAQKSKLSVFKQDPIFRDSLTLVKAMVAGLEQQKISLEKSAALFSQGINTIDILQRELKDVGNQLNVDKERQKQLLSAYNSPFSALHIIQEAETPKIKSRPIRSLIVIGTTAFVFVLTLLWVTFMQQYKEVNWKRIFSDEPL